MSYSQLYIFDLDGTLANIDHRRPILEDKSNSRRWDEFYNACHLDGPNEPVIHTMRMLIDAGCDVWIFSGRSRSVEEKTKEWLRNQICKQWFEKIKKIRMRDVGDYTPDDELKLKWVKEMSEFDLKRLVAVFDDRDKVVKMWRDQGVTCFQVDYGDF